eukprot:CAMPEP_0173434894 /NCGR_PEP_ID=MMETSP1357-20121228/13725_1 /TAXON_ID=77926 /ORGANISM="Hemiselmis rufescens, Strain PCC563" /LENGTH=68 /DNA_ID=CAMNT_0014399809 /DNA_START=93 /DNA_END=299 /DNA_ORIENTATION=+
MEDVKPTVGARRGIKFSALAPILWAPTLPVLRIVFQKSPHQAKIFGGALACALCHGTYTIMEESAWRS